MDRYKFLHSYHYVENEDGVINNPATDKVRTCTIYGNHGTNLIPYPFTNSTKTINGITFTDNGDGTITANGTATATAEYVPISTVSNVLIKAGVTYTLSGTPSDGAYNKWYMYAIGLSSAKSDMGKSVTFTGDDTDKRMALVLRVASGVTAENVVFKPQLEEGEAATAFEKWCGVGDKTRNLIPYPYSDTTKTTNGITFTDNGDGSVTVNGTATAAACFHFILYESFVKINKKLFICGCPRGGSASSYSVIAALYNTVDGTPQYVFSIHDVGDGAFLDCTQYDFTATEIRVRIETGTVCDNLTFKPMLIDLDAKNLIPYPYARTTQTLNGITFTDNGDGTITINGTATADAWYPISTRSASTIYATKGKYHLSGCPSGGSDSTYFLQGNAFNDTTQVVAFSELGNGRTVDLNSYAFTSISVNLNVREGVTVNNLTFRPLLVELDSVSSYEPYGYKIPIKNQSDTTNIYTPKQIMQGESATFNEPFKLSKANQLSVETAVKPSAVKYTYYTY